MAANAVIDGRIKTFTVLTIRRYQRPDPDTLQNTSTLFKGCHMGENGINSVFTHMVSFESCRSILSIFLEIVLCYNSLWESVDLLSPIDKCAYFLNTAPN